LRSSAPEDTRTRAKTETKKEKDVVDAELDDTVELLLAELGHPLTSSQLREFRKAVAEDPDWAAKCVHDVRGADRPAAACMALLRSPHRQRSSGNGASKFDQWLETCGWRFEADDFHHLVCDRFPDVEISCALERRAAIVAAQRMEAA
jgi:hypothetical protein